MTGFTTLGLTLVIWWAAVMLQWQFAEVAEVKMSFGLSLQLCVAVVPAVFRRVIKLVFAQKRPGWIEELVRTEGARRDVLEPSFTLDSW